MSLLPGQILPQSAPLGTVNQSGTVTIEKNWWLLLYNIVQNSIGGSSSIPDDALELLESCDIDAALSGVPTTARALGFLLYPVLPAEVGVVNPWYPYGNVLRYGADLTGNTDTTAQLTNAASIGIPLYFPEGTYKTSATIAFIESVRGLGRASKTLISCTNLTVQTATVAGTNIDIENITFTHPSAPVAASGAHGLILLAGCYQVDVMNCVANFNDMGFVIESGSSALWLYANNGSNNASSGFLLIDPNYVLDGNLSTSNGTHGYEVSTVVKGAGLTMTDNLSYNNTGDGYHMVGTVLATLNDIFLSNNISSFDEGNGLYFDLNGINILIANHYCEYSGYDPFGIVVDGGAVGYTFTANNISVNLEGCQSYHCASDGLFNGGADITITGGKYNANGGGSGGGYGIQGTNAGFTNVTGANVSGNITGQHSTIAGFASFYNCPGINQATFLTPPAFAGTGVGVTNPFNIPATVYMTSALVTSVEIKIAGTTSSAIASASGYSFNLPPGGGIIPTYTGSPTWIWTPN